MMRQRAPRLFHEEHGDAVGLFTNGAQKFPASYPITYRQPNEVDRNMPLATIRSARQLYFLHLK